MANLVAVAGESGSGKTYSMRNLDPKTCLIINVAGKPLPWRGWKKEFNGKAENLVDSVMKSNVNEVDVSKVVDFLRWAGGKESIKYIIIDDFQYVMSFTYLNRATTGGWEKFNDIADHVYKILGAAKRLPADKIVVFLCHDELPKDTTKRKIKTVGQALDKYLTVEGLFTSVLFTDTDVKPNGDREYRFKTNDGKYTTAKTPPEMFPMYIPNDLNWVLERMHAYDEGLDLPELPKPISQVEDFSANENL